MSTIRNLSWIRTFKLHYHLIKLIKALFVMPGLLLSMTAGASQEFDALQKTYEQTRSKLSSSAFRQPLILTSSFNDDEASGEIYAVIENGFSGVSSHLIRTQQWCDMLVLHINVKGCYANGETHEGKTASIASNGIRLYVGRNFYQPIEDAYVMEYILSVPRQNSDYLKATLTADEGPFGTSEYLLVFEAIPLANDKTFIHFKYSYRYGFLARVALQGYLATLGRQKVGFSIDKYDEDNNPVYVKGVQGIVERNSMRYFISIRAFLETFSLNNEGWDNRVKLWYQLALPYERQLLEVKDKKYIETKYQEFENRVSLETALANSD